MSSLLLAALLACGARAETGWKKAAGSLLLQDSSGTVVGEQPLGKWEENRGVRVIIHAVRGGASKDGRFAWTFDEQSAWNYAKTERLERRAELRFFGTGGNELWSTQSAAAPSQSEPLALSDDGETALLAVRLGAGWRVEARNYLGIVNWDLGPFPILENIFLTGGGRYAMVRWGEPDKSSTYSFLDLKHKKRHDIPSAQMRMGEAKLLEDGSVVSGGKTVFAFEEKR